MTPNLMVNRRTNMRIPLSVRLKAIFARDKNEFWWNHFTDEERELREVDVSQLASVINEATVRHNTERRIVAEHMLSARLAQIQSRVLGVGSVGLHRRNHSRGAHGRNDFLNGASCGLTIYLSGTAMAGHHNRDFQLPRTDVACSR